MAYSSLRKLRVLLGDPGGTRLPSGTELNALLDRGRRDIARRGLAIQQRTTQNLTSGTRVYTLPTDHLQTFALLVERFATSVRLLSQDGYVWYLFVTPTGILGLTDVAPAGNLLLNTSSTYWLTLASPDAFVWYLYPSPTGTILVSDTQPATGTGTLQTIQLRDIFGGPWYPVVSNTGDPGASQSGTATLSSAALEDRPLHRVQPEAITGIDPRLDTGRPQRYAVMGKILLLAPTPDAAYQLVHLYFADTVAGLPAAFQHLPLFFAAALAAEAQSQAGQELLGLERETLVAMSQNLWPGWRDGLDFSSMPPR